MNFAFPALLIVLLVAPGLIVRYWVRRPSRLDGGIVHQSTTDFAREIAFAAFLSLPFHAFGYFIAEGFGIIDVRLDYLIFLLGGAEETAMQEAAGAAEDNAIPIITYGFLVSFAAYLVAVAWREASSRPEVVRQFPILRPTNRTWEYFSGFREYLEGWSEQPFPDAVIATALVHSTDEGPLLYRGELDTFLTNREGEYEVIVLANTVRHRFDPKENEQVADTEEAWFIIPGNYMVIERSRIVNLNLAFFYLEETDEEPLSEEPNSTV